MFPHKGSSLCISAISEADSARLNKIIGPLAEGSIAKKYCYGIILFRNTNFVIYHKKC